MRCLLPQALWPEVPPEHAVTAVTTSAEPPALWTGAADGGIIRWNIDKGALEQWQAAGKIEEGDSKEKLLWPVAMLCGHASAVTALEICNPADGPVSLHHKESEPVFSKDGASRRSSTASEMEEYPARNQSHHNDDQPQLAGNHDVLLSICHDGTTCVWDVITGRCRRRRRLPPWAGQPEALAVLAKAKRYVCVACSGPDKSGVLIIDTAQLAVVQTVAHGNLGLGIISSVAAIIDPVQIGQHTIIVVDTKGKFKSWKGITGPHLQHHPGEEPKEPESTLKRSLSREELALLASEEADEEQNQDTEDLGPSVISPDGEILLILKPEKWELRGTKEGRLLFEGGPPPSQSQWSGGVFLRHAQGGIADRVLLHTSDGAGYLLDILEEDSHLTASISPVKESTKSLFCQLSHGVIARVSVNPSVAQGGMGSEPQIDIFRVPKAEKVTQTRLTDGWLSEKEHRLLRTQSLPGSHGPVTSSILIGGCPFAPGYLVRGYADGVIRIFGLVLERPPQGGEGEEGGGKGRLKRHLRSLEGHKAAVLCLAEQQAPTSRPTGSGRVLLSGSADWTVRIWDASFTGPALAVLRMHAGPVREIVLPPPSTPPPWLHCFGTVSDDCNVALTSLDTLQCERILPGHPVPPQSVAWDGGRGYLACLSCPDKSGNHDTLYIWDLHSGARDRILRGHSAHSLFTYLSSRLKAPASGAATSALNLPTAEEPSPQSPALVGAGGTLPLPPSFPQGTPPSESQTTVSSPNALKAAFANISAKMTSPTSPSNPPPPITVKPPPQNDPPRQPIRGTCPLPGVASLTYDLLMLMSPELAGLTSEIQGAAEEGGKGGGDGGVIEGPANRLWTPEGRALRMALGYLHLWGVAEDLDEQLKADLQVAPPEELRLGAGLFGDKGAVTLLLPGQRSKHEFWRTCPEFGAVRCLALVALAQRLMLLSKSARGACGALAAHYSRGLLEKLPGMLPPSLEVYACFWQDSAEHLRLAARSLFHNAALRSLPPILRGPPSQPGTPRALEDPPKKCTLLFPSKPWVMPSSVVAEWLEANDNHDWVSVVGGSHADAKAARTIVAAALSVWYPSVVRPDLPPLVLSLLLDLVLTAVRGGSRHSATSAELLAEGMASTWAPLISDIHRFIAQVVNLHEQLSVASSTPRGVSGSGMVPAVSMVMRESLANALLPALCVADVSAFLSNLQAQYGYLPPESPTHLTALMTLIRAIRANARAMAPHLINIVAAIIAAVDPSNPALRRACQQTAMAVVMELVKTYPMVSLHRETMRLAVGEALGDVAALKIDVYDVQNAFKVRVLDASSGTASQSGVNSTLSVPLFPGTPGSISALAFASDGDAVIAFSRPTSALRWWTLGSAWWQNMRRTPSIVQCTKMVIVPPLPGLEPPSKSVDMGGTRQRRLSGQGNEASPRQVDLHAPALQQLELNLRLEPKQDRTVTLYKNNKEIGTFTV